MRAVMKAMTRGEALAQGRESLRLKAWGTAYARLSAADSKEPLDAADLQGLAMAAQLVGKDVESAGLLARAHQGFLSDGATLRAARCAFWLGYIALFTGDSAQSSGWLGRARRLLEGQKECVEHGYMLMPEGLRAVQEGDASKAYKCFAAAAAIGERFGDKDLATLALHGQGRALIRKGEIARGVALLDEAMIAVRSEEVGPIIAGAVYCSVIESCRETFDLGRAREWTTALERWCESQPEMVPYRGHCLLHRAEILQLQGAWSEAFGEAERAREQMSQPPPKPGVGAAFYRLAELHRLRGEFAAAEEAYRQAKQWERTPEPGIAQLRLAQGQLEAARAAIRSIFEDVREGAGRIRVLDAYVEIALAANDVEAARGAADELAEIASKHGAALLRALSSRATGAVLLAEGDARGALESLRRSWTIWRELEAPHDAARVRVLIARACGELGDTATADLEMVAAREVFRQLGAVGDLAQAEAALTRKEILHESVLTGREVEVLRLVASGMTNRKIAGKLSISEKTVARHLSNIFTKLDLSSRAAATAYAYQNGLVRVSST
jgi:ATP/maltotriose-dependent transcriptional regulator MalT